VPAFAAMLRGESPPPGSEALSSDGHHAAFSMLVKGLAADRPLVWVVEDLHFAEPERRRVAVSMARAARGCRALVLLTSRPGLPESELLALSRLPGFLRLSLGRLSPREVVELLRDAFRSPPLAERLGGKAESASGVEISKVSSPVAQEGRGRLIDGRPGPDGVTGSGYALRRGGSPWTASTPRASCP
jgi:hypothetical protein